MTAGNKMLRRAAVVISGLVLFCALGGSMEGQGMVGDTRRVGFITVTEGPPTVADRPVVARWEASWGGEQLSGVFERNHGGDTRTEMYAARGGPIPIVAMWSAQEHLRKSLDYRKRSVITRGTPQRTLTSGWKFYVFDAIWSDEYQTIQGQRARKITLMEADGLSVAGHSWISEDLGLVL